MVRRIAAVMAVVWLGAAREASAQADVCQALAAQLARVSGAPVDPLSDAVMRQRQAYARASADYQRACSPSLFGAVSPNCPALQERLGEMQANLGKLEAQARRNGAGDLNAGNDRARILTAMRQNGCSADRGRITAGSGQPAQNGPAPITAGRTANGGRYFTLQTAQGPQTYLEEPNGRITRVDQPQARVAAAPTPRSGGFFGQLFGERVSPAEPDERDAAEATVEDTGAFRTLCVRLCDGYYFPISYATSRGRFGGDSDLCRARCPGAETRLFAHPTGTDSETAVSADDQHVPYTRIPNALRYRTEYVSSCTCGSLEPGLLPLTASVDEGARTASSAGKADGPGAELPVPRAKPEPDEDPDTRANAFANFVPLPLEATKPGEPVAALTEPRTVRVIGPKFFANR